MQTAQQVSNVFNKKGQAISLSGPVQSIFSSLFPQIIEIFSKKE